MGKRKVDIFTVVESINNWFEANNHDLTIPEGSAELGNQSGPNEDAVQAKGIEADESGPRLIGFTVDVGSGTSAAEVAPPGGLELEGGTTDPIGSEVELEGGPKDPLWSEVDDSAKSAQEVFWRLLQTVGYECW